MAKNKYYLIAKFSTKEDFDKHFEDIYNSGYSHGFRDGRINALSYFTNLIYEDFEDDETTSAAYEATQRNIANWRRKQKFNEDHDRYVIREFCKKHGIKVEELTESTESKEP